MTKIMPKWLWAVISVGCILVIGEAHWLIGYELNVFVFYFIPIAIGAWFIGLGASMGFAILSALVWFWTDSLAGGHYSSPLYAVWNTMVRLISFIAIGWAVSKIRLTLDLANTTAANLKRALSEIKVLEGFLPICMQCKKIRNESGSWERLETYIGKHSAAQFSHGYCPECGKQMMVEAGFADNPSSPMT
jgi:hypothetical protein